MAGIPWTKEEERILIKSSERGLRAVEVAKILKSRTINSITAKATHMRISLAGTIPEIDYEAFKKLIGE